MSSAAPIGVFDSGLGGVNVLAALIRRMPNERYLYFGDTAHNPYGTRPLAEVRELTWNGVRWLLDRDAKAVVIACNTATSGVVHELRTSLTIPVFGIEPAIKPALLSPNQKRVLLMATPLTIAEQKLQQLLETLPHRESVIPLACPGLAELIEHQKTSLIKEKLQELFQGIQCEEITGVVLGCTHYPLIQSTIEEAIGHPIQFFDGSEGLARHVREVLEEKQQLTGDRLTEPCIELYFTGELEAKRRQAEEILQTRGIHIPRRSTLLTK